MGNDSIDRGFSVRKAHEAQLSMSKRIICKDRLPKEIRLVAGVDVAYAGDVSIGAVAVYDFNSLVLVEEQTAFCKTPFPYVPTLLSFRELPPAFLCIRKLQTQPDLLLVDGHGFAHPYRCGFASHLGLALRKPTIGVAKSKLVGEVKTASRTGVDLIEYDHQIVGAAVTTQRGCEPVYVSVGHMISLETAIRIVKHCTKNNRVPEPILSAHRKANSERRKINIPSAAKIPVAVDKMLNPKLDALAKKIRNGQLRRKVVELLKSPNIEINGKTYAGLPLETSPAGVIRHHSYPGGFIEHVASTANLALALCDSAEKVYHGTVNRDLVLAGVLLHDIFKPATYSINKNGSYSSAQLADYLDHLSLATSELLRRGFPLELVHIVSAHHGEAGPMRPRTIEALICHLADWTDSRLNGEIMSAAAYLARRTVGQELLRMNSKEAFEIVRSKSIEGWEGVAKTIGKIGRRRKSEKT